MPKINVLESLACTLGRRDEEPNIELAKQIAASAAKDAIVELVGLLQHKNKDIQNDSIKVLYEAGAIEPKLLEGYLPDFLAQLKSKNNRMVWGAMTAIDCVAGVASAKVYNALPEIIDAGEKGSVIAKDHVIGILVKLSEDKKLAPETKPLLFEQLIQAAPNQLPMYAEKSIRVITDVDKPRFVNILNSRLAELPKDSQKKRIEKLLKQLRK